MTWQECEVIVTGEQWKEDEWEERRGVKCERVVKPYWWNLVETSDIILHCNWHIVGLDSQKSKLDYFSFLSRAGSTYTTYSCCYCCSDWNRLTHNESVMVFIAFCQCLATPASTNRTQISHYVSQGRCAMCLCLSRRSLWHLKDKNIGQVSRPHVGKVEKSARSG